MTPEVERSNTYRGGKFWRQWTIVCVLGDDPQAESSSWVAVQVTTCRGREDIVSAGPLQAASCLKVFSVCVFVRPT